MVADLTAAAMSKRDEIVAIIWDVTPGCVDPAAVADRIIACMAEPSEAMVDAARADALYDSAPPDIVKRLHDACVGHPAAQIPWPHRLLHDAADEIDRLRGLMAKPSEAMVKTGALAMAGGHWGKADGAVQQVYRDLVRAALVAAGRVMGGKP